MPSVLIVGPAHGPTLDLAWRYTVADHTVTCAVPSLPTKFAPDNVAWVTGVDMGDPTVDAKIASGVDGRAQDIVVIAVEYRFVFWPDDTEEDEVKLDGKPEWEVKLDEDAEWFLFLTETLCTAGVLVEGSKVIWMFLERNCSTLQHYDPTTIPELYEWADVCGTGASFGHVLSKSNMDLNAKLLIDSLKQRGVTLGLVHPAAMTGLVRDCDMRENLAVNEHIDERSLMRWIGKLGIEQCGEHWAPTHPRATAAPRLRRSALDYVIERRYYYLGRPPGEPAPRHQRQFWPMREPDDP